MDFRGFGGLDSFSPGGWVAGALYSEERGGRMGCGKESAEEAEAEVSKSKNGQRQESPLFRYEVLASAISFPNAGGLASSFEL